MDFGGQCRSSPGALLAACAPPPPPPPPQGPDLSVTDITWPSFNVGDRVPFLATITNIGDTPTPPNTIVDVLFTVDADTLDVARRRLVRQRPHSARAR